MISSTELSIAGLIIGRPTSASSLPILEKHLLYPENSLVLIANLIHYHLLGFSLPKVVKE